MKHCLLIAAILYAGICIAQPYQTGRRSVTFIDASRSNRSIATELFYPAALAGNNVPVAADTIHYPVVVFGHGFVIGYASYNWLADSLVKNGYIVAMPITEGSLSPNHEQFGKDLAFLCQRLIELNDSSSSFLFQKVKNRAAVGGHSMGGGASFLATGYGSSIHALFNFAAAETNPSAKAAASLAQLPALIFAGSNDCIVPDSNQLSMYNAIPYPCKTFINITNALHCHFANNNGTCATGQFFSGCNNSGITATTVFSKTLFLLLPFLDYYLKSDCSSRAIFNNRYDAITGVTKARSCTNDPYVCTASVVYQFVGSGNWDIATNWLNQQIPPTTLASGATILINPAGAAACILNRQQTLSQGATFIIAEGKQLQVQGDLLIRQ